MLLMLTCATSPALREQLITQTTTPFVLQAQGAALEKALANDPDATAYAKLIASLKIQADESKTVGTMFVPTDRVSCA
jgi:hypothetical protein